METRKIPVGKKDRVIIHFVRTRALLILPSLD